MQPAPPEPSGVGREVESDADRDIVKKLNTAFADVTLSAPKASSPMRSETVKPTPASKETPRTSSQNTAVLPQLSSFALSLGFIVGGFLQVFARNVLPAGAVNVAPFRGGLLVQDLDGGAGDTFGITLVDSPTDGRASVPCGRQWPSTTTRRRAASSSGGSGSGPASSTPIASRGPSRFSAPA